MAGFGLDKVKELVAELAREIAAAPTAPFHEGLAREACERALAEVPGIRLLRDAYGNVIARLDGGGPGPAMGLVAHLDHPGFEVKRRIRDGVVEAAFLGGVERRFLEGGRIRFFGAGGGRGRIASVRPGKGEERFLLTVRAEGRPVPGDFGMWDLPPLTRRGDRLHGRACDDLAGVTAAVALFRILARERRPGRLLGFFTRAEEVGFVGTLGLLRGRAIPPGTFLVNIEASRCLPGVAMGGGPVVRVGDRAAVFDREATALLARAGENLSRRLPGFSFQRKLMDGGTCEATPLLLNGFRAGAVCVPLLNYHNMGRDKAAAESVDLGDLAALVLLLREAFSLLRRPEAVRLRLHRRLRAYERLLPRLMG